MFNRGNGANASMGFVVRGGKRGGRARKLLLGSSALIAVTTFAGSAAAQSTYTVSTEAELATAIANANGNPGSTIVIGSNITLFNLLPAVTASTTFQSAAGNTFTISGNNQYRLFFVDAGSSAVSFNGLVLSGGRAQGGAGGTGAGGGGGGMGAGGAIFVNSGNVTATDVSFTGNTAAGGSGGAASVGGSTGGGGGGLGGSGGNAGIGGGGGGGYSGGGGGGGAGTHNGTPNGGAPGAGGSGPGGAGGNGTAAGQGLAGTNGAAGGTGTSSNIAGNVSTYGGGGGGGGSNAGVGGANGGGGGGGGGYTGTGGVGGDNTRASAALDATGVGAGGGGSSGSQLAGDGTDFGGGGGAYYGQTGYDSVNNVVVSSIQGIGGQGGYGAGGGGGGSFPGGVGNTVADAGGQGGFGGGGGGDPHTADSSSGGVGGGRGNRGGGGGMGAGGAVFVRSGSFSIAGSTNFNGGTVTAGAGVSGSGAGAAAGSGMFLNSGTTTGFAVTGTMVLSDTIADDSARSLAGGTYTAGNGAGAAVSVTGGGTLVLTGTNTYAGGTTVTGSTLRLGNGGATGTVAGTVTLDNGVLEIGRTGTTSNAVSGTGSVRVLAGATLSGALSVTGGVDILADTAATLGNIAADNATSAAVRMGAGSTLNTSSGATLTGRWGVYNTLGAATINNAATMTGVIDGINQQPGSGALTLTNTGTIRTTQGPGSTAGIYINAFGNHSITNNSGGAIIGGTDATYGYGISIDDGSATITNNSGGTIGGAGAAGAIRLSSANAQTLNLNAGSTVTGNVFVDDGGAVNTVLAGTLAGAYNAGTATGAQTFTLASTGSMQGATFGSGNDSFTFQGGTIAGTINGGAGNDSFTVDVGTSTNKTINLSNIVNFDSFALATGNLTLTGSRNGGAGWTVAGGNATTFILNGALTNIAGVGVTLTTPDQMFVQSGAQLSATGDVIYSSGLGNNIQNSGTITSGTGASSAIAIGSGTVENHGLITYAAGGSIATQGNGVLASTNQLSLTNHAGARLYGRWDGARANSGAYIVNDGLIQGDRFAGVEISGTSVVFNNATGRIYGATGEGSGLLINSGAVQVSNSGQIVGAGSAGIYNVGAGLLSVTNAGTIATGALDGSNNYIAGGSTAAIRSVSAVVSNSGLIEGASSGIITSGALTLTNTGTIRGLGTGTISLDGIHAGGVANILNAGTISQGTSAAIHIVSGGTITNAAAGTLTGGNDVASGAAVFLSGGMFNNFGTASSASGVGVRVGGVAATINLFAGSTTGSIQGGSGNDTLAIYNAGAAGDAAIVDVGSGITVRNAGVLAAPSYGTIDLGGGNDTLQLRGTGTGGAFSIATATGAEALTKLDSGTWTLNGAAIVPGIRINAGAGGAPGSVGLLIFDGTTGLAGDIYLNAGTIRANTAAAFGTGTIHSIDPTIQFGATGSYANDISLEVVAPASADPTVLSADAGVIATLTGRISRGAGDANQYVTIGGGGAIVLANASNSWSGTTAIDAGSTLQGATNTISGASIVNAGTLVFSQNLSGTFSGNISGAGTLQIDASGHVVTLSGTNTNNGATHVMSGRLSASGGAAIGDTSAVDVTSGATLSIANNETVGSIAGAGTVSVGGNTLTTGGDNASSTFTGVITGTTPIIYIGSWTVSNGPSWGINPPTYTGQEAAAFIFGGAASDYRTSTIGANTSMINDLAWYNTYGASPTDYVQASSTYRIDSGSPGYNQQGDTSAYVQDHVSNPRTNYAFKGGLHLGGGLTKTGTGTLSLTGANTYIGLTSILGGTIAISGGAAIADAGSVNVAAGATFSVRSSETIASLNGSGATVLSGSNLALGNASGTYSGTIAGLGALALNSGSLTLNGAATQSDGVMMADGTVLTLGATGSINATSANGITNSAGAITVVNSGTITGGTGNAIVANAGAVTNNVNSTIGTAISFTGTPASTVDNYGRTASISATGGGTLTVNNFAGGLIVRTFTGSAIDMTNSRLALTNAGDIVGYSWGVVGRNAADSITNSGRILTGTLAGGYGSTATISGGEAISLYGGGGSVTNQTGGLIHGGSYGIAAGGNASVSNQANAFIRGNIAAITIAGTATVSNAGSITSTGNYAILVSGGGSITSSGEISGALGGINVSGSASTTIDLQAHSTTRAILASGSGTRTVNVAGSLSGYSASSGAGVDALTLAATGSISGAVTLGAGNDSLLWQGGTFTSVDAGAGIDSFTSALGGANAGSLALSTLTNFESYTSQSGNLTLTGDRSGGAGWVLSGGSLTLSGTLTNTGVDGNNVQTAGIAVNGANTTINLSGGAALSASTQNAIQVNFFDNTTINNNGGTIGGSGYAGIRTNRSATINNNAGGTITSNNATATAISNSGAGVVINNAATATISGANTGIDNSQGLELTAPGLTVNNSGMIRSTGTNYAIRSTDGTIAITNASGGVITGGIAGAILTGGSGNASLNLLAGSTVNGDIVSTGSGARSVILRGAVNGSYNASTGTGIDTISMHAGATLTGGDLGGGDDIFNYFGGTISGVVDGGAGSDMLFADFGPGGSGNLALGHFTGFEGFGLLAGDLTITGPSASPGAAIYAGNGAPAGQITFSSTADLTGDIYVNGGSIRAATAGAFGTGTIHMIDPAAYFGATGTYANNISLEVQSPASADPSTLSADYGVVATLTGAITQGTGAGVDTMQPLVIAGAGTIVLTNAANAWAGSTTINSGSTLQGSSSSISGSGIVNNGALNYNQTISGTVGQNISGTGRVNVSGLAMGQTLTFGGIVSNDLGITIADASAVANSGTIAMSGNSNAVSIAAGGSFANTGTVNGAIGNLGSVAAAVANSGAINGTVRNDGTGTLTLTNAAGGTLTGPVYAVIGLADGGLVLNNAGDISASQAILSQNNDILIANSGRIVSGVFTPGGYDATGTFAAIDLQKGGSIANLAGGLIGGGNIAIQSAGALNLTTEAGSTIEGNSAINAFAGATIANAGAIRSNSTNYAIGLNAGGTITNTGTIAGGTDASFGYGINATGTLSFTNGNGGVIGGAAGAILAFNTATIDLQAGSTTNGKVQLIGNAGNIVTVAGTLNGVLTAGSGNDVVTLVSGMTLGSAAAINGGAGTDVLALTGAGNQSLNIGLVTNFENRSMNGAGIWTLSGTDTSTSAWTINSGTLAASGGLAIHDKAAVAIAASGTLRINNDERIGSLIGEGNVALGANTLTVSGGTSSNYAGVIGGTGNLTISNGSALTLSGTNIFSGLTTVGTASTLRLGGADVLASASQLQINGGGTVDLQGFGQTVASAGINGALNGTGTLTASRYELGGATINANLGAGVLVQLSGTSTLTGTAAASTVQIGGGTLLLGASDRLADNAIVSIGAGAVLDLGTFNDVVGSAGINGALNGTGMLTASRYELGGATINANLGGGVLAQLSGTSTLTGTAAASTVQIGGGTLLLGASDRLADNAIVSIGAGAVLDLGTFNDVVGSAGINGTLNGTGTLTAIEYGLTGAVVNANLGTGGLINNGGVTLLNGTHAGLTVGVRTGTLTLGAADRLSDTASVWVGPGATLDIGSFSDTVTDLAVAGTLNGTGTLVANRVGLDGATVNANLGTSLLLGQTGGVSTLNGTSGAANVEITGGTLKLGASERLLDTARLVVGTGTALDIGAFNETVDKAWLDGTLAGTGTLNASVVGLRSATVNANLGAGTLLGIDGVSSLNGSSAAGIVDIQGGTLALGANERLANNAALAVNTGATFDLAGFTETVGTLSNGHLGAGTLALGTGRLVLSGNGDSGFSGAITGSGSIDKQGHGRLTLAGDFATTGRFDASMGTLAFLGSSQGGARVNGGTLIGQGSFAGNLTIASGTFSPGGLVSANNAIQPIGSFQAQSLTVSGGSLLFDFGGANLGFASDSIRVTGPAVLSGGTVNVNALSATNQYAFENRYVIVQAGTLTGTFANGGTFADVASDPAMKWRLRYDLVANAVVLQVQKGIDFAASVSGGSPNQQAIGQALNGAAGLASDDWSATLNAIAAMSPSQRTAAFNSMSGEAITDTTTSSMMANNLFIDLMRQRFGDGDDKLSGAGFAQNATGNMRVSTRNANSMASRLAAQGAGNGEGRNGALWSQAFGGYQRIKGNRGQAGLETSSAGVAMGAEGRIGDVVLGVAGALTEIGADVDSRNSNMDGRLYQAGGYASYDDGVSFLSVSGTYYSGKFDTLRLINLAGSIRAARGNFDSQGYALSASIGTRIDLGNGLRAVLTTSASKTHDRRDAFAETGAGGLSLAVAAAERDLFAASSDLRIGQWIKTGSGYAMPYVNVGLRYSSGDLNTQGNMRFAGAPTGTGSFQVQGAQVEPFAVTYGGGVDVKASERVSLGVSVENAYGNRTRESRASMRVKIGF